MSVIQTSMSLVRPRFPRYVAETRRYKYKAASAQKILKDIRPKRPGTQVAHSRRSWMPTSNKFVMSEVDAVKSKNKAMLEENSQDDLFELEKVDLTDLRTQMNSLSKKGFLRAYKPYSPPNDLDTRFTKTCSEALGKSIKKEEFSTFCLDNKSSKFKVLTSLNKEFQHCVHNSRLHEITTLDDLYVFYKSPIDVRTPYEQLANQSKEGSLPPNLCIQLDPIRFTGKGDHELDKITAFPRSNTITSNIYMKEKYPGRKAEYNRYKEDDYE